MSSIENYTSSEMTDAMSIRLNRLIHTSGVLLDIGELIELGGDKERF